jgi:opacity protein-like surface antigen
LWQLICGRLNVNLFKLLAGAAAVALIAGTPALAADLIVDVPVDEPVAVADMGWYLSVFGGAQWTSISADDSSPPGGQFFDFDSDIGWQFGVALGANFTDNLRGEVELSSGAVGLSEVTISGGPAPGPFDNDTYAITDGSASVSYLLGNLWFDIDTGSGFTPYIGGGLGAGYVTAEGTAVGTPIDMSGWGWAYQVGAGVKIDVADNMALDLGYRYKAVVGAELEGGGDDAVADLGSHVVQVGLTFGF